jgi:hypothetical protein
LTRSWLALKKVLREDDEIMTHSTQRRQNTSMVQRRLSADHLLLCGRTSSWLGHRQHSDFRV